jgi:hypothetical protein
MFSKMCLQVVVSEMCLRPLGVIMIKLTSFSLPWLYPVPQWALHWRTVEEMLASLNIFWYLDVPEKFHKLVFGLYLWVQEPIHTLLFTQQKT